MENKTSLSSEVLHWAETQGFLSTNTSSRYLLDLNIYNAFNIYIEQTSIDCIHVLLPRPISTPRRLKEYKFRLESCMPNTIVSATGLNLSHIVLHIKSFDLLSSDLLTSIVSTVINASHEHGLITKDDFLNLMHRVAKEDEYKIGLFHKGSLVDRLILPDYGMSSYDLKKIFGRRFHRISQTPKPRTYSSPHLQFQVEIKFFWDDNLEDAKSLILSCLEYIKANNNA